MATVDQWPDIPLAAWRDTFATLHLWTQIVGKIRLVRTPWLNHSWHATLYVTSRGLTTSPIPYEDRTFELEFDFTAHRLELRSSDGRRDEVPLRPQTVAAFYRLVMDATAAARSRRAHYPQAVGARRSDPLRRGRGASIVRRRVRAPILAGARPGRSGVQDLSHALHRQGEPGALLLGRRRSRRDALLRPACAGASGRHSQSAGFGDARGVFARGQQLWILARRWRDRLPGVLLVRVSGAGWFRGRAGRTRRSVLQQGLSASSSCPYDRVARAASPDDTLLEFLQSTYEAAASLGSWDRAALEVKSSAP